MRKMRCVATAGMLAACAALAPAASAADGFTKRALAFDVKVGPNGDVPCTVVADLYVPDGASATDRVPAILATNGFGGSKDDFAALASSFAKRGYAFLAYSGLGFGGSGCKITLDDPDYDGRAGSELVSFLGGTKAAKDGTTISLITKDGPGDPRVGITGGSYGGQNQFAVASVDDRVDAINPQITWNDLEYSLAGNNTDLTAGVTSSTPGVAKLDWPVLFTGVGIGVGLQQSLTSGDTSHLGACPNFADRVCPGLLTSGTLGYADAPTEALLRHASVATYMKRIKIPTFISQGEQDTLFNLQEAVATYRALRAQGTPAKLLFRDRGHSGGSTGDAEWNETELEKGYESRMVLEWFDWYLRGIGDAPKLDFSFFRGWAHHEGDAAPAVGSTPSYPAATAKQVGLAGRLSLFSAATGTGTSGAAFDAVPAAPPLPGTEGALDTGALAEDVEVAGIPSVTFDVDAPLHAAQGAGPASRLVLFARVDDVAPDSSTTTPGNIVGAARVGDATQPVTIELPGIVHRFAAGHRVRVAIGTAHALRRGNVVAGPVTISNATLTLPKLGAVAGATGSGPSGTTPYTPSPEQLPVQKDGAGGRAATPAADLPTARKCRSRRRFTIRLRAPRGDRVRSAKVLVNGNQAKVKRRRRAVVDLRGLPKGTYRVQITVRTAKGKVLRSARTYRTCTRKR